MHKHALGKPPPREPTRIELSMLSLPMNIGHDLILMTIKLKYIIIVSGIIISKRRFFDPLLFDHNCSRYEL